MLRSVNLRLGRRFQYNTKYPSLVSYNKLPWEVLNHETPQFHMHVAPHYEQILTLAAATQVPHLISTTHMQVPAEHKLRLLPGLLYTLKGETPPEGFTAHRVEDPTALQYYGNLNSRIAHVLAVRMFVSDDLRLLCNSITFRAPLHLPVAPHASLASLLVGTRDNIIPENNTTASDRVFTLYHYARPNRPASELQLEKYYIHKPRAFVLAEFSASSKTSWEPKLQAPKRTKRVTPLPPYKPPQSYLMGLAERLGVVPGSCFGRRSLMWGHWF